MNLSFKDLEIGDKARIIGFESVPPSYKTKLISLGLTQGTEFLLKRCAPFGDPVEINIRGFNLTLRRAEAAGIRVEKI
jgi:ferrous iron transport protein A